jgi:hypothetical protein
MICLKWDNFASQKKGQDYCFKDFILIYPQIAEWAFSGGLELFPKK